MQGQGRARRQPDGPLGVRVVGESQQQTALADARLQGSATGADLARTDVADEQELEEAGGSSARRVKDAARQAPSAWSS